MTSTDDIRQLIGCAAVDYEGNKLGKVGQVYVDDRTGQPVWVTVATGMFGTRQSFAPIYGARNDGEQVVLAVSKDMIQDAPNIEDDQHIDPSEQEALYRHYAGHLGGETAQDGGDDQRTGRPEVSAQEPYAQETRAQGRGTAGSSGDDAMTRSEERLRVGTEGVEAGRVRLRKYVVTENVTTQVPVSHEEVRVEREPVSEANRDAAMGGPDITEAEHEVTVHAERPVVEKEAVPVERVRLGTEKVTEEQEVSETVRKEQIEEPDLTSDANHPER
jgi:uncharacterized protein (TIGR02271 family)